MASWAARSAGRSATRSALATSTCTSSVVAREDQNQRRKILLDFNIAEAMWLEQIVPLQDRPVIDQYLSLLRGLEEQLSQL